MSRDRFSVLWSGITWWSMGTRPDLGGGRGLVWFGLLIWDCKQSHSQVSTHAVSNILMAPLLNVMYPTAVAAEDRTSSAGDVKRDISLSIAPTNSLFKFGYQPIRDQYFLIRSVSAPYILACVVLKYQTPNRDKPDTRSRLIGTKVLLISSEDPDSVTNSQLTLPIKFIPCRVHQPRRLGKYTTNQSSLFRSRDWLSANQGPVFSVVSINRENWPDPDLVASLWKDYPVTKSGCH
eukprot:sb/3469294/